MKLRGIDVAVKRSVPIRIVDAFSDKPFAGNPAGVVLDASALTKEEMQKIAGELNLSVTAFLSKAEGADFTIRYFTPTSEIAACGHGTVATFFAWGNQNLRHLRDGMVNIRVHTGAGVSPVEIKVVHGSVESVTLTLTNPTFKHVSISVTDIADALNIPIDAIERRFPFEIVYDGLHYLVVGVKDRASLLKNQPSFQHIRSISKKIKADAFEVFSLDTSSPNFHAVSRTYLPAVGIDEDPVCGTGNSALASYLVKNRLILIQAGATTIEYTGEQGHSFSRPGIVTVLIDREGEAITRLRVRGKAVEVMSGNIAVWGMDSET